MNIDFCTPHAETLADLMALAKKHNCVIRFGFYSNFEREVDRDILQHHNLTDELVEELYEKMEISDSASTFDKVWFELYDNSEKTSNTMAYLCSDTYFVVKKDGEFDFRLEDEEPSEQLVAWLEEHDEMYDYDAYTISLHHNPTVIYGFGNKGRIEDYRCYRSGMALKFFGDLVCDYLNEPRIQRCY